MITLADALMSLVDTLCVGQFGSTIELASLGESPSRRSRREDTVSGGSPEVCRRLAAVQDSAFGTF
jgi:hypothetical protein